MPAAESIETLIVDDQRSMRALLRQSLHELGLRRLYEVGDGKEALQALAVHPMMHLVISDFNMPNMDGIGLLRAVRSRPDFAKTAFIMLTSHAEAKLVQEAIQLGANNYIVKPFTLVSLKKKIEAVFGPLK